MDGCLSLFNNVTQASSISDATDTTFKNCKQLRNKITVLHLCILFQTNVKTKTEGQPNKMIVLKAVYN